MRLFFALWPPPQTAHALGRWASEAARETGGKVTASDQIHLTLAFLGEADPGKAFNAAQRVRAARCALPIDDARYWKHNKIVWVGPQTVPVQLENLVGQLHAALAEGLFVLEKRPFAAHITLIRKARLPGSIPPLPVVEWPVNEFLLVRSRTSPKGSSYAPIERFSLS